MSGPIDDVPDIADPVELDRGGFATVYRAVDLLADRPVAVKLVTQRPDDATLRAFERERVALARLSTHPNVVTLHRTGTTPGGHPWLVMEFAPGGSLADLIESARPLPLDEALAWILPICDAVEHAHAQGVQHRDIKPRNILISAHRQPLLSDFGIAAMAAASDTITHQRGLSLSCASAEQIDGAPLDERTDVYSLAATLYALLAGRPAFADPDRPGFLETAKRILEEDPPPLDDTLPAAVRHTIAAAMAKDPSARPTIAEFRRGIRGEIDSYPPPSGGRAADRDDTRVLDATRPWDGAPLGSSSAPAAGAGPARPPFSRALVAVLGSVAVLAGIALLAIAWSGRDGDGGQATGGGEVAAPGIGDEASGAADDDLDDDGIVDALDNCPSDANGDQADEDADGLGDACDDFPDRDADGIIDTEDDCIEPATAPDTDGDGTPDACDATPLGMVAVAVSAEILRVTVLNQAYGDGETDLFGELAIDDAATDLPEIADLREVRPSNWFTGRVPLDEGSPVTRIRIALRDRDNCFLCRDGRVDLSPTAGVEALHLVVDPRSGQVELADGNWNRVGVIGALTGSDDGDLSGTIVQEGDDDGVHRAAIEVRLALVRQPVGQ